MTNAPVRIGPNLIVKCTSVSIATTRCVSAMFAMHA